MNNSQFVIENISLTTEDRVDHTEHFREREGTLVKILDAIQSIQKTKQWSSLKIEVFDDLVKNLEKDIASEAKKENPNPLKLRFLAGELKWAEKFSDLTKLENDYRVELTNVRKQLYGKTEKGSI